MSSTSSTFVYVLLLQNNKYYIGKTSNPNFRLAQHFNFNGSAWTKKYKPIRLVKLIPNCDKYDEDKYTKKYMGKYGINNVRGGAYCSMVLSGRKELKEIFCGCLGYGAWFISDFYIKKDYFLPNSKLLLKKMSPFTYLHASDILICDVEKVTIKNIYSGELGLGKLQNEVFLIYTGNDQNKQAKTVVLDRFVNGKTTTEIRQKRLVDTIGSDRQYTFGTK